MRLPKGTVLFQQGDPGSSILILYEGQVKLQCTSREGKQSILKIAMPGDVLGLGTVISGTRYEVTAEVLEPATVKSIRKEEFLSFLKRHNELSIPAARVLSEEHKSAFFDERQTVTYPSAASRLACILLDLSRKAPGERGRRCFTMALTHEELANLAGTSRETITRMLGRFRREGWLRVEGSSMTILDPECLIQLVS
ncbi:MAG TPA: Crp/Fnr family transcriptional regulator [Acidobacteriaceae bacterium]|nr:Crp/Fnr family transcriptional regulator [Acidobacteriaceae bacterium]